MRNSITRRSIMLGAALASIAEASYVADKTTTAQTPKNNKSSKGTKAEKKAAKKNRQRITLAQQKEQNDATNKGSS